MEKIKNYALYGDTDEESFEAVRGRMQDYNRIISLVFASVATILITAMFFLSCRMDPFSASKPVYVYGIAFSLILIVVSLLARRIPILSFIAVYMAISVFMIYGIALGVLTRPEHQTVTFMVLLIFVPMIFVDRPINMAVSIVFYVVLFIVLACERKSGAILYVDITDAMIFGFLAIFSETVVNRAKIRGYVLEHRLHIMSETDQLTGVNNRNCYEMRIAGYGEKYKDSICCIYIDVNGLHELNNTKGHKAGDDMLIFIASAVADQFGREDVYRVGGDEYVAFALDESLEVVDTKLTALAAKVEDQGYHAAIGYEFKSGRSVDMDKLTATAEKKMYESKAEYYRSVGRGLR